MSFPTNIDAERFVLGSIMLNPLLVPQAMAELKPEDFNLEKHRRIYQRSCDVFGREEAVDRLTVANELAAHGELESVDGLTYLTSLDDGMPIVTNLDSWIRVLKEKAAARKILWACQGLENRVALGDNSAEIVAAAQEHFAQIGARGPKTLRVADLPSVAVCNQGRDIEYIRRPELPRGAVVALTGDAGSGKSTLATAWARNVTIPVLILDRENPLAVVADRLERLKWSSDDPRLRFWGGWLDQEPPLPDAPAVTEWAGLCDPKPLVIVDSLSAFFGAADQNDASIMRGFLNRCRRLANLGATVLCIHHSGKAETARDYRGSSDFPGSLDLGFHVSNIGTDGGLGRLLLRPFKTRIQIAGTLAYDYGGGQFTRADSTQAQHTVAERLGSILRLNPGITARKLDELAKASGLGRDCARGFLHDGLLSGAIRRETGPNNAKKHYLAGAD